MKLAASLAQTQAEAARGAMLPQVGVRGAFEADRQHFVDKGGANWLAAVALRWNLFNGFADKARIAETGHLVKRAEADRAARRIRPMRLEVRRAWADLQAAAAAHRGGAAPRWRRPRKACASPRTATTAGMSNVTDLLRNETALLESRTRYLAAIHDQRVAATMLELAAGRLLPRIRRF